MSFLWLSSSFILLKFWTKCMYCCFDFVLGCKTRAKNTEQWCCKGRMHFAVMAHQSSQKVRSCCWIELTSTGIHGGITLIPCGSQILLTTNQDPVEIRIDDTEDCHGLNCVFQRCVRAVLWRLWLRNAKRNLGYFYCSNFIGSPTFCSITLRVCCSVAKIQDQSHQ